MILFNQTLLQEDLRKTEKNLGRTSIFRPPSLSNCKPPELQSTSEMKSIARGISTTQEGSVPRKRDQYHARGIRTTQEGSVPRKRDQYHARGISTTQEGSGPRRAAMYTRWAQVTWGYKNIYSHALFFIRHFFCKSHKYLRVSSLSKSMLPDGLRSVVGGKECVQLLSSWLCRQQYRLPVGRSSLSRCHQLADLWSRPEDTYQRSALSF